MTQKIHAIIRLNISLFVILLAIFGVLNNPASAAPRLQSKNLTIDKQVITEDPTLRPGETIQFELTVTSLDEEPVENLTIKDNFDATVISISDIQVNTGEEWVTSSPLEEEGELAWVNIQLEANQVWQARYNATIANPLPAAYLIQSDPTTLKIDNINKATVEIDNREVASSTKILSIPIPGAGLKVKKTVIDDPSIGTDGVVRFNLSVENQTEGFLFDNLTVVDNFKGEATLPNIEAITVLDSSILQGIPVFENLGDQLIWNLDSLGPGNVWFVEYESTIEPFFDAGNKQITNATTLLVTSGENNFPLDEAEQLDLQIRIPHLILEREITSKSGEDEFRPGDSVIIKISYHNAGTDSAIGVVLQDSFDEKVVEGEININNNGRRNGSSVVWDLGAIAPGAAGEVSYEVNIKTDLLTNEQAAANPNVEVTNQAVISAENMDTAYEDTPVSFIVRTPILKLSQYKMDDLNGGKINPGDLLRFTIALENQGTVPASAVSLQSEFDQGSLTIDNISAGGNPDEGKIVWDFEEILAGGNQIVTYDVLVNDLSETRSALNNTSLFVAGTSADQASLQINIEPTVVIPTPAPANTEAVPFEQKNFEWMALLIGGLVIGSLAIVGYQTHNILKKEDVEQKHLRDTVEMFTILVIVSAVLILAMVSDIGPTPAVGVLSGIAGYVLGRSSGSK
jgi:hypothetical protein